MSARALSVVLVLAASVAGCGATRSDEPSTTTASTAPTEPTPTPEEQPLAHVEPTDPGIPRVEPGTECSGPGECTGSYFAVPPVTEADCACPTCETHVMGLARLNEISEADARVCGAWRRAHTCPRLACPPAGLQAMCVRGACVASPIIEAGDGPSPCRSPADCPSGIACVINALGGDIGCTDGTCCSAAECVNGCASDADCPSCRPSCVNGACRNPHGPK